MPRLDEQQVYQWFDIFKHNGDLVEIRLIGTNKTASGYFTNASTLIEAIKPYTDSYNVYFTLNKVNDGCYGREQKDKVVQKPKNTTTDTEITHREWVLIDLDAKRLPGVCATKEEATMAYKKGQDVYRFLMDNGFNPPVVVFSSSGIHLYLRCALVNTDDNTKLIKRFLEALSMIFSDEHVEVDEKVFNSARISRLPGSYSCKGANNDPVRPQRKCRFLKVPEEIMVNEREYFEKIAQLYPEEAQPTRDNHYSTEKFDLNSFFEKHNIEIAKVENVAGGKKYVLKHCVFNEAHTGKDAVVFQRDTGEIAYHCFHQHCAHYTWKDVRLKYEPNAYDKKDYREYQFKQRYYDNAPKATYEPIEESPEKGKKWLTSKDIKRRREADMVAIPTGFTYLDKAIRGLLLGETTILSGINGSGKSSWLNTLMLNVIDRGYKVACFSGELTDYNVMKWLSLSAAGKNNVRKLEGSDYSYEVDDRIYDRISEWLNGRFYLFNNSYGNRIEQILNDVKDIVGSGVNLIVLDNLMSVSISSLSGDKNEKQKQFILDIVEFAKRHNVHVIVVCHPRKESGGQTLLRKESISGSSDLSNAVQNIFIIHRCGEDFSKRAAEFFGKDKAGRYMEYDNVIEVCKNRSYGVVDYLVGMFYEIESKRFKNYKAEHIMYGWNDAACHSGDLAVQENIPRQSETSTLPFQPFDSEAPF